MQGAQKPKAHTARESIKHEACLGVLLPLFCTVHHLVRITLPV